MVEFANVLVSAVAPRLPIRLGRKHIEIPRNPLFASLSRQQTRLVLPHLKYRKFRSGRILLQEGSRNPGKIFIILDGQIALTKDCLLYTSPSPRDGLLSRMPSSA